MAIKIEMPKLSDTMTEGVLVEWLKKEGDLVKSGDIIAEVETDKATMEVEVFDSGVLLKTMIEKGSTVKLGEIIAIIGQKDEDISALLSSDSPKIPVSVEDKQKDQKPSVDVVKDQETSDQRIKISPLARSIAKQNQIEISSLLGSGPGLSLIHI
ncbi:MAG: hypothetical protein C4K58_03880 [Flavobacteriaceae bacterium]|nr:MAG: hypothetical protein C4K58_03880 [Flavobacteriaceae bacterium]